MPSSCTQPSAIAQPPLLAHCLANHSAELHFIRDTCRTIMTAGGGMSGHHTVHVMVTAIGTGSEKEIGNVTGTGTEIGRGIGSAL